MSTTLLENPEATLDYSFDKKQEKRLNLFWTGIFLYTAAYTIGAGLTQPYTIAVVAQTIGIICIIGGTLNLAKYRFDNKYLNGVFTIYLAWMIYVAARGISFNVDGIKYVLFDGSFGLFVYLSPMILLFPLNLQFFKKLFSFILVLGLLYLFYDLCFAKILLSSDRTPNLVNQNAAERFTKYLSIPVGFLLFTINYHSKRNRLLAILIIVVNLLLVIYRARRGLVFICSVTILFAFLIYILSSRSKFLIIIAAIVAAFFGYTLISSSVNNQNNFFGFLLERNEEDTRSPVEDCFYADMKTKDWIVGKGMTGDYYCPNIDEDDTSGYRDSIETDYLNTILKGGVISLGLMLLMAVPAVLKGLFFSKNILSKAAAFWILLWMVSLYPSNVTTFSLNYLLVWICIGICHSKELRNIPEEDLVEYFRNDGIEPAQETL
ncbi:MAG: hypothetical protein QM764_00515 [Chitinophagaceae bacterium]